ncbi:adenylate cyclase [Halostagnicola larsenii XH-48]|uniref:Adenylate cyclase n=1 Tax=Halostagnicola larsenii XH-48 TaxID=797299 RepID=W0JQU1_9EURY|nr:class IV adenylate cyclase [Halostagnicola larsenii]AHF99332.1 adenylate cyclase [Halostagnicola larsenii XH-48]
MYEVEVKVPADLERVRERLTELEATALGAVVQTDTYYDAPHRSFAETDEALRIRRERPVDEQDSEAVVTYKGPLVDDESKTREEIETGIEDGEAFNAVLRNLGFEAAATVSKRRERFELESDEGYTITCDAVDGVGEYVEVETDATDEDLESAREGAFEVLDRLDLDAADTVRTSYLGMLLEE